MSVVDSTGALLSAASDDESAAGLDTQQLQYRREVEASHLKRVMALLEPVVGRDNVRASVSAEIDFSQVMQTAEAYRPNQGSRRQGRRGAREQRSEEASQPGSATPAGVPGATSNQPPTPATAPDQRPGAAAAGHAGQQRRRAWRSARKPPRASRWTRPSPSRATPWAACAACRPPWW